VFFLIQSALVLLVYGLLFAREMLMIICFFCHVLLWTCVLAVGSVFFSAPAVKEAQKRRKWEGRLTARRAELLGLTSPLNTLAAIIRQWLRLWYAVVWKKINGEESSMPNRPNLGLYLILFLDFWILLLRTLFQIGCLMVFKKWCPPLGFPPMIKPQFLRSKSERSKSTWIKVKSLITKNKTASKRASQAMYATNVICIIWSILAVELTIAWNNISGVYTLNSTGQLIPFIIGIVSFIRLLQGISIDHSKSLSTDILMELLDAEPPPLLLEEKEPELLPSSNSLDSYKEGQGDKVISLHGEHDGYEAVFWTRKPERRRSIGPITRECLDSDRLFPASSPSRGREDKGSAFYRSASLSFASRVEVGRDLLRGMMREDDYNYYGPPLAPRSRSPAGASIAGGGGYSRSRSRSWGRRQESNKSRSRSTSRSRRWYRRHSRSRSRSRSRNRNRNRDRNRSRNRNRNRNRSRSGSRWWSGCWKRKRQQEPFAKRLEKLLTAYFVPLIACLIFLFPCSWPAFITSRSGTKTVWKRRRSASRSDSDEEGCSGFFIFPPGRENTPRRRPLPF